VSSGFGRIMTEQLLARGDRIAGTVRNLSVMDDLKAEPRLSDAPKPDLHSAVSATREYPAD
jgi:hypothetical protein